MVLRTEVRNATDLAYFEKLYSTSSDKLLAAYALEDGLTEEQAKAKAFHDAGMGGRLVGCRDYHAREHK
ncbi:hypothetical protein D3C76_1774000 [compost metagenome]